MVECHGLCWFWWNWSRPFFQVCAKSCCSRNAAMPSSPIRSKKYICYSTSDFHQPCTEFSRLLLISKPQKTKIVYLQTPLLQFVYHLKLSMNERLRKWWSDWNVAQQALRWIFSSARVDWTSDLPLRPLNPACNLKNGVAKMTSLLKSVYNLGVHLFVSKNINLHCLATHIFSPRPRWRTPSLGRHSVAISAGRSHPAFPGQPPSPGPIISTTIRMHIN